MERIKFEFRHKSKRIPLIKIIIDNKIYKNLLVENNDPIIIECDLEYGKHSIEIVHYGKDYFNDGDKSFELECLLINDVDIKYEIFDFIQYPDIPPWEDWHNNNEKITWKNNLHLGYNGKIVYNNFETPSVDWFKKKFVHVYQPIGMKSSSEVLTLAKQFLEQEKKVSK